MSLTIELIKFLLLSLGIVLVAKFLLANYIRKLSEIINLNPKITGQITGITTSAPELLSVISATSIGLIDTSIFNILSSNIINVCLFLFSLYINKNFKYFKNFKNLFGIKMDILITIITIIIPIILIITSTHTNSILVPVFAIAFLLCMRISQVAYKNSSINIELNNKSINLSKAKRNKKIICYIFFLLVSAYLLYILSSFLEINLNNLCRNFNISQFIIGILLGIITSMPELITFLSSQKYYKFDNNEKRFYGVIESLNNLSSSNILNLFFVQTVGLLIYTILY